MSTFTIALFYLSNMVLVSCTLIQERMNQDKHEDCFLLRIISMLPFKALPGDLETSSVKF